MKKVLRVSLVLFFIVIIFCGCGTEGISTGSGEKCIYKLSERGFICDWLVAGTFPNPVVSEKLPDGSNHLGFYKDYLESLGGESQAVLSPDMEIVFTDEDGSEGKVKVISASVGGNGVVNFDKVFGRLDILVNNAGITRDSLFVKMTEEDWDQVLAVNLKGVFNCTQLAVKMMSEQKVGRIVNVSSASGQMGNIGQANYAASKAGVIGVTKTLAKELARFNINVNSVAPGFINTPMTEKVPEKVRDMMKGNIPLRRFGEPEDVAKAVKFLVTDDSDYITGQTIACNGGLYI